MSFPPQNDDEKGCRRQKSGVSGTKTTTIRGFVAKKVGSPSKSDDEKGCRHQKVEIPAQKRRREWLSSPKNSIFGLKTTTRTSLVAKKWRFPHKNDDEKGCRRQKKEFPAQK
ncbi:hypothetical protein NST89_03515 [Caldifermentibacillus hisashii]|uniref:hypothetical protein n=1 Tax=Caldifermentibacillus hisashii TaxID=996558 RepID=UPI003134E91F